jgi:3-phenylpropionate/trans-cinnamate dioxygenase ferredoxin reductase subunit
MTAPTLAVIGASLAGAKAAEAARTAGFDGSIVLIGDEPVAPYERPPLSKSILRGEAEPVSARVHPDGFYDEHGIACITERAVALDTANRRVALAGGGIIPFDAAVLATGSAPRTLTAPGADLANVFTLRTLDDAVRLRDAVRNASRVAVVGAGWIGSEVAASVRQMGLPVVLVDPGPAPLHRVLGDAIGGRFRDLHRDHGVELRMNAGVDALVGSGTVEAVQLADGRTEPADVVVVGIGVTPRTELAEAALGIRVEHGIVVDQFLETTVPGIYAAGDVADAWHPRLRRHLRVEHWANALNQGLTAGANAAGGREQYDRLPYFFSDQYDFGLEYVGHHGPDDSVAIRGDLAAGEFIAFWHRERVVTAAMHVNAWGVIDELKAIVASASLVDLDRLVDADTPLIDAVPRAAA